MVAITPIIATKRVYPLSPIFFNNQYLILKGKVNMPLSRNFFLNSYFIFTSYNYPRKIHNRSVFIDLFQKKTY